MYGVVGVYPKGEEKKAVCILLSTAHLGYACLKVPSVQALSKDCICFSRDTA